TASDGQTQTSASAQATIEDSPAILTANAPTVVDAGTVVHFQVSASDPDGDPSGTPVLLYGPYGMSLTAAGMVSWTAELPLFDQQLDVNWAVGIPGTESNLAGTIRVRDLARPPALLRSGLEVPRSQAAIQVVDLDGDGISEAIIGGR